MVFHLFIIGVDKAEDQLIEDNGTKPQSSDANSTNQALFVWEVLVSVVHGQHVGDSLAEANSDAVPKNPPQEIVGIRESKEDQPVDDEGADNNQSNI